MLFNGMKIRDVLSRDLSQRIEPVVKVYDRDHLAEDMRQFVITDSLARELRKFFDAFTENLQNRLRGGKGGEGIAAWIWGFFGSGKSHVAKVIGCLLENEMVEPESHRRAMDIFNLHLDDPTLLGAADLKALLAEIRNHAWCKTIAFEIKSKLDQANPESVTEICLRSFYESNGLSPTIWLARLERKLQVEGLYNDFLSNYSKQNEREWHQDRGEHGFYLDEIAMALASTLDRPVESAREMMATYQRDHSRVSPENFARELMEYLENQGEDVKPRLPHLIFVIDEMGQFIGDSQNRIEELRAIVEQTGVQGRGQIWFICTSQEALDQVVDRTGLNLSALGKLDARFSTKIPLTGEDVRRVVQDRLLRKKEASLPVLQQLYAGKEGVIEELCNLRLERRLATIDRDNFIASYPFLPHSIPLLQELFNAMRGFKLSGTERSMIGVAQGTLQSLANLDISALAPLDTIFDQVTDELSSADYLGTTGIKLIRESDNQIQSTPVKPSRVLKALWLISRVEWIPRTPEVLAKLLADHVDTELARLRDDIQETLDRLQKAGLVAKDDATGQYRYLSEEERGLEEDIINYIQDLGPGIGVAKRRANTILKEKVITPAKMAHYKFPLGKSGIVGFSLYLDDEVVSSAGEIIYRLYSPLASPSIDEIEQENLAKGTKGRVLWWVAIEEQTLIDKLKRLEALDKVPQKPKWRNDRSDETLRVLKEKEKERASLETHLAGLLENCLKKGRLFYSGEIADLNGGKELKASAIEFASVVTGHLYTRYAIADKTFEEKNIPLYLKSTTKSLDRLDTDLGIFDAQGHLIHSAPLIETVFEELRRRQDEVEDLDGKAISEHFQKIPFGWSDALVRLILAAMFRGGALYVQPPDSDQPIYDLSTPVVEALFTGPHKFRKTRFFATTGGLTPSEVKEVKDALIALGETGLPDAGHALGERIRTFGARLVKEADKVRQRVEDLKLPLPDTYHRAELDTKPATSERDPIKCVRQFLQDQAAWKEIAIFLNDYQEFVEQKRDASFRNYVAVMGHARECPALFEGEEGANNKAQLAEFDAIVAAREIMPKWKALQAAALAITDRYRQIYRSTYEACSQAIKQLRSELETAEAFTRLDEPHKQTVVNAFFGPNAALALPEIGALNAAGDLARASDRRKVSELEALRLALPGYRAAIYETCEKQWQLQQEAKRQREQPDVPKEKRPEQKLFRVKMRERLAGKRFVTKAEFETFWQSLGKEIALKIGEGFEVILEE